MARTLREAIEMAGEAGLLLKDNANEPWQWQELLDAFGRTDEGAAQLRQPVYLGAGAIIAFDEQGYQLTGEPLYRLVPPITASEVDGKPTSEATPDKTSEMVTIAGRVFEVQVWQADHGWCPMVWEHTAMSMVQRYTGGEDDPDDETPEAAMERGKRYARDVVERPWE